MARRGLGAGLLRMHRHPLFFAAANGRYPEVERLIRDEGMSPDLQDTDHPNHDTPLMVALADHQMVRLLLRLGANANFSRPGTCATPLHVCARLGFVESAMELVSFGADSTAMAALKPGPGEDRFTPFHIAVLIGDAQMVLWLLSRDVGDIDQRTAHGWTALHIAAFKGHYELCRLLEEHGASVTARTTGNPSRTVHELASLGGNAAVLDWASERVEAALAAERRRQEEHRSLLRFARQGDVDRLREAATSNTNRDESLHSVTGKQGWNLLHVAARFGREEVVRFLLQELQPPMDPEEPSSEGSTALHLAARNGHEAVINCLLSEHGVDPLLQDGEGMTARAVAARFNHVQLAGFLHAAEMGAQQQLEDERRRRRAGAAGASAGGRRKKKKSDEKVVPLMHRARSTGLPAFVPPQVWTDLTRQQESTFPIPSAVPVFPSKAQRRRRANALRNSEPGSEDAGSVAGRGGGAGDDTTQLLFRRLSSEEQAASEDEDPRPRLREFLTSLRLEQYLDSLEREGFESITQLACIEESDLEELGMKRGHKRTLLRAVSMLRPPHVTPIAATAHPRRNNTDSVAHFASLSDDLVPPSVATTAPGVSEGEGGDSRQRQIAFEELQFHRRTPIGEGSFGVVYRASWRGMDVAVKTLKLPIGAEGGGEGGRVPPWTPMSSSRRQSGSFGSEGVLHSREVSAERPEEDSAVAGGDRGRSTPSSGEAWGPPLGLSPERDNRTRPRHSTLEELEREASMMSRVCHHDNVIQFIGMVMTPQPAVVTRFMAQGSVEDLLVRPGPRNIRESVSFRELVRMAVDAAAGVLHLHQEGIIHRDLAARNLLVDETRRVRVADFGFARVKLASQSKGYTENTAGPLKWMAPEACRFRQYSEKSDVFSFGVTLYEIIEGSRPWEGAETFDVVVRVAEGERLQLSPSVPTPLRELMQECWQADPESRPSMEQVHARLRDYLAELEGVERDEVNAALAAASADDQAQGAASEAGIVGDQPLQGDIYHDGPTEEEGGERDPEYHAFVGRIH